MLAIWITVNLGFFPDLFLPSQSKALESQFPKLKTFSESAEPLSRNRDPNRIQNLHVCTICCRPEVVYDVISGRPVKTIEGYHVVNFEVAISNSFRYIQKNHFVTAAEADIDDSETLSAFRLKMSRKKYDTDLSNLRLLDDDWSCRTPSSSRSAFNWEKAYVDSVNNVH